MLERCPLDNADAVAASFVKSHPVFERLPNRCLLRQAFKQIAPAHGYSNASDEVICGAARVDGDSVLQSQHIVVRRHGAGRLVFVSLRVMQALATDALAQNVFVQLVEHFARRSVPARQPLALDQGLVEWHRKQRTAEVWRWRVMGAFAGANGHDQVFPPEEAPDSEASYPGAYRLVQWRAWHSLKSSGHTIDFHTALRTPFPTGASPTPMTAYAATEFNAARRGRLQLEATYPGSLKAWLNGKLVYDSAEDAELPECTVKQGRNTLLLKSTSDAQHWRVGLTLESAESLPIALALPR